MLARKKRLPPRLVAVLPHGSTDDTGAEQTVRSALGDLGTWCYVPRVEFVLDGNVVARGCDAVAETVAVVVDEMSGVKMDSRSNIVRLTGTRGDGHFCVEFEVRFGLIGSVDAWSMRVG